MITVAEITALAKERRRIRSELATIGREIYAIREGSELPSVFSLSSYQLGTWDGTNYAGMDDIDDWELGTPLLSICFYSGSWEEARYVTFPQAWLTQDWKQLETARVTTIQIAEAEAEAKRSAEAKAYKEESERRTYERLKKKYEKENS